jgi:hypothetical protein
VPDKTETTILLDIYERLGAIENELKTLIKDRDAMDKDLNALKDFKQRIGAYIVVGGGIVSGALVIVIEGAKFLLDRIFPVH